MDPNETSSAPRPAPKKAQKKQKKLTRDQRWWRHNLLQAALFFLFGVVCSLILIGLTALITLPFRSGGNTEGSVPAPSPSPVMESSAPTPTPTPQPKTVTLIAVGDNLIHDTIIDFGLTEDGGYDFTDIYRYIQEDVAGADLACIQQETIYIDDPNEYSNYPMFGTPTEMADSLTSVGFDVVCHASNHALDKGLPGIQASLAAWKKHPEVTALGIHDSQEDADQIHVVEKNGVKLALLDYTYGLNGFPLPEPYTVDLMDEEHRERIETQIQTAKSMSDMVIVFMHDGTEDALEINEDQKAWAQFFADQGVGLIIGTHPHVIEPMTVLKGKDGNDMPVFYSLGNLVSSQADNINMLGAMAHVTITKDSSGTYVSAYSATPLVTWIHSGGTHGLGYQFHVVPLEEYSEEMESSHIRKNCTKAFFQENWQEVFPETAPNGAGPASGEASAVE